MIVHQHSTAATELEIAKRCSLNSTRRSSIDDVLRFLGIDWLSGNYACELQIVGSYESAFFSRPQLPCIMSNQLENSMS